MDPRIRTFLVSPRGRLRIWIGVLFLGLPALFILNWFINPEFREWHITGVERGFAAVAIVVLFAAAIAAGLYFTLLRRTVTLDRAADSLTVTSHLLFLNVRWRVWRLSEFAEVELRHRPYGESPSDAHQCEVGVRHGSGMVVWLQSYLSQSDQPPPEALAFVEELKKFIKLSQRAETTRLPLNPNAEIQRS